METKKFSNEILIYSLVLIAIPILFVKVFQGPNRYIWDEVFYLPLIENVCKFGFTEQNLIYYKGTAPGPGFQFFLGGFLKLTSLSYSIHLIRLTNLICFISIPFIFYFNKNQLQKSIRNSIFFLFLLLSLPFNYPLISIGVSDTLAVFFLSLGLAIYSSYNKLKFIISLICLASASVSRQTLAVFYIVPFVDVLLKKEMLKTFIVILFSTPLIFLIIKWKGIVPPDVHIVTTANTINLGNLTTHFIYVLALIIITSPKYFLEQFISIKMVKYYIPISLIISIIFLNFGLLQINNRFSEILIPIIGSLISNLFLNTIGLISMILTFKLLFRKEISLNVLFYKKIALFLFLFTPLFITHSYSSKYLAIVSPIWIALLFPVLRQKFISLQIVLFIICFFVGKSIIENYYL